MLISPETTTHRAVCRCRRAADGGVDGRSGQTLERSPKHPASRMWKRFHLHIQEHDGWMD